MDLQIWANLFAYSGRQASNKIMIRLIKDHKYSLNLN